MKRGFIIIVSVLTLVVTISCGSTRHVASDPIPQSELDGYAADHFFKEGIRMYNQDRFDAAMDLMMHSMSYDTASAATCYSLA